MFEEKVKAKLKEIGVTIERIEKEEDFSIVCHIPKSDNNKISEHKDNIEKELNAIVALSDSFGMNVVIIEQKGVGDE